MRNGLLELFTSIEKAYVEKGRTVLGGEILKTGFTDLQALSPISEGDFVVLASHPNMGKTSLLANIVINDAIKQQLPVYYAVNTLDKQQATLRMLCSEASIEISNLQYGNLEPNDWTKLVKGADRLAGCPIMIYQDYGSIDVFVERVHTIHEQENFRFLAIDSVELFYEKDPRGDIKVANTLKALALELKIVIIAIVQLSCQKFSYRKDKKPYLTDLPDSYLNYANVVWLLHREDYFYPNTDNQNIVEIIIAKHPYNPIKSIKVYFHKNLKKYSDLTKLPK